MQISEEKQNIISELSELNEIDPVYEIFVIATYAKNYWVHPGKYIDDGRWDSEKLEQDFTVKELRGLLDIIIYCADIDFGGDAYDSKLWEKWSLAALKQFLRGEYRSNEDKVLQGFPKLDKAMCGE